MLQKIAIVDLENVILEELKTFFGQPGRIASHLLAAEKLRWWFRRVRS